MAKPMAMPFNKVSIKSTATRSRSAPLPEKGIATEAPHDNAGVCPPVQLALPGGFSRPARRTIPRWPSPWSAGRLRRKPLVERTMESVRIPIAEIYVPTKRRQTLRPAQVDALAQSIMEEGLKMPIPENGRALWRERVWSDV